MRFNSDSSLACVLAAMLLAGSISMLPAQAHAETNLNAAARISFDNNVNGSPDSPSKANQLSDSYETLSASGVYFTPLDKAQTWYFIGQLGALTTIYNKYNNLDSSMLVGSAGLYKQLSSTWSIQGTGRGFSRITKQVDRNSNGVGASLELKKQLTKTIWLKGVGDYEVSTANLKAYSYTGITWGANLGYLPFKDTFLNLGYSHNSRKFKTAQLFKTKSQTLYAELSQRLSKNWYLTGGVAGMKSKSNYAGTAYTNYIESIGLSFSY
ncbi:MAG: hypothetical protein COZ01_02985 [Zetaproteobacteria bacterium CG_4_10_14_0_8_um_filter_55_43]|nr:MAG: hypothetical protein COZ01_02985 [Zetaproteobacteria bacterium CG_4_10_14_0_8_um_filter_55_43]